MTYLSTGGGSGAIMCGCGGIGGCGGCGWKGEPGGANPGPGKCGCCGGPGGKPPPEPGRADGEPNGPGAAYGGPANPGPGVDGAGDAANAGPAGEPAGGANDANGGSLLPLFHAAGTPAPLSSSAGTRRCRPTDICTWKTPLINSDTALKLWISLIKHRYSARQCLVCRVFTGYGARD